MLEDEAYAIESKFQFFVRKLLMISAYDLDKKLSLTGDSQDASGKKIVIR